MEIEMLNIAEQYAILKVKLGENMTTTYSKLQKA